MQVQIATEQYELSHNKKPRGTGLWFLKVFSIVDGKISKEVVMLNGKLSDCVSKIKEENKCISRIIVMP